MSIPLIERIARIRKIITDPNTELSPNTALMLIELTHAITILETTVEKVEKALDDELTQKAAAGSSGTAEQAG